MLHGKIGGICIGGLAAYLIFGKIINAYTSTVKNVCEASKWKAYYKHANNGNCVAPGYRSYTRPINDESEFVVEDPKQEELENKNTSNSNTGKAIVDAVVKAIEDKVKGVKPAEGPLEGETEASEEEIDADLDNLDEAAWSAYKMSDNMPKEGGDADESNS